jgi:hypothetical protein
MGRYAVLNSENIVSNVIVAESLSLAESVTQANCILETGTTGPAEINYLYSEGVFSAVEAEPEV